MIDYKDKIIIFPLFNTCYPQNLARNLASFFDKIMFDFFDIMILVGKGIRYLRMVLIDTYLYKPEKAGRVDHI